MFIHMLLFAVEQHRDEITLLPDYLEVELSPSQNQSDSASENYDDIDQLHSDNEDYDDVGWGTSSPSNLALCFLMMLMCLLQRDLCSLVWFFFSKYFSGMHLGQLFKYNNLLF